MPGTHPSITPRQCINQLEVRSQKPWQPLQKQRRRNAVPYLCTITFTQSHKHITANFYLPTPTSVRALSMCSRPNTLNPIGRVFIASRSTNSLAMAIVHSTVGQRDIECRKKIISEKEPKHRVCLRKQSAKRGESTFLPCSALQL